MTTEIKKQNNAIGMVVWLRAGIEDNPNMQRYQIENIDVGDRENPTKFIVRSCGHPWTGPVIVTMSDFRGIEMLEHCTLYMNGGKLQ